MPVKMIIRIHVSVVIVVTGCRVDAAPLISLLLFVSAFLVRGLPTGLRTHACQLDPEGSLLTTVYVLPKVIA